MQAFGADLLHLLLLHLAAWFPHSLAKFLDIELQLQLFLLLLRNDTDRAELAPVFVESGLVQALCYMLSSGWQVQEGRYVLRKRYRWEDTEGRRRQEERNEAARGKRKRMMFKNNKSVFES